MKTTTRISTIATLAATLALAAACAKQEAPAPSADTSAAAPVATAGTMPADTATGPAPEPTPGSPVATFTPSTGNEPAPMLPMLGATPIQPATDEHSQSPEKAGIRRIAAEEAAMLVQTGDAIILDVRSKEAYEAEHIKGAVHIPYGELAARARKELTPTRWIIPYCT